MSDEVPDPPPESPPSDRSSDGVPIEVFHALNDAVEGARRLRHLGDVLQAQTMLALWDAVVLDETARGLTVQEGGKAERAFGGHLAGLLQVSRNRAVSMLHTATSVRALPVSYAIFGTGTFGWQAVEAVVRNLGALSGAAREQYDLRAGRLAAETVPQLLDAALARLHDSLDHADATDAAASAHRSRTVQARPGAGGSASLVVTGPQTDIAAVYETARKVAVAAHGAEGETRSLRQLMYDAVLDTILAGFLSDPTVPVPANIELGTDGGFTPSTPQERLGDPRVPQRKVIRATILVTVPAATAAGAADEPGRLNGWGSVAAAEVRRIVASARYWTRVETDPVDDAILAFDSSERAIPAALRRLIWARSETCDEPGCPVGAHLADLDHVIRVEHGGRTTEINLSALCRGSHQTKDDGYVDVERTPEGTLSWNTTRWGGRSVKRPAMTIRRATPAPDDGRDEAAPWDVAA